MLSFKMHSNATKWSEEYVYCTVVEWSEDRSLSYLTLTQSHHSYTIIVLLYSTVMEGMDWI